VGRSVFYKIRGLQFLSMPNEKEIVNREEEFYKPQNTISS